MLKCEAVWVRGNNLSRAGAMVLEVFLFHWEAFRLWRKGLHLFD